MTIEAQVSILWVIVIYLLVLVLLDGSLIGNLRNRVAALEALKPNEEEGGLFQ